MPPLTDRGAAQVGADSIRAVMWYYAGIVRTARGLREAIERLDEIGARLPTGATEEANMLADRAAGRRSGGPQTRVARRTLPCGLSPLKDELAWTPHRVVEFWH